MTRTVLRLFRPLQRMCHHVTPRDREITKLYRELGEHHLRDSQHQYFYLLERIRQLENQLDNLENPETTELWHTRYINYKNKNNNSIRRL